MNLSFGFFDSCAVNGARVKQAREQALLTQAELADSVSVSQPMIAHIEQGLKQCSPELAEKISARTGTRLEFLYRRSGPVLPVGSMLFRARSDVSAKKLSQTSAVATNVLEIFQHLAGHFDLPAVRLRPVEGTPEEAASQTRELLGLGPTRPIPHLMRAFEKLGGVILSLPELPGREAFAVWEGNRPVVGIGPSHSGDRLRFSMAHEIGHLILHGSPTTKATAEREAHRFAGELLAPQGAFTDDVGGLLTVEKLGRLKQKWGISMAAILYRAKELSLVSRRLHDRLIFELAPFRTKEPPEYDVPLEKPRALRQMAEMLYRDTMRFERIAAELALPIAFVRATLDRYAGEEDIAESSRKRKVVNIQTARKERRRRDSPSKPTLERII
jgi:Zn-dependent peptidase ImmA (M78 family)/DNA-binding XRE family transcriptional regulator